VEVIAVAAALGDVTAQGEDVLDAGRLGFIQEDVDRVPIELGGGQMDDGFNLVAVLDDFGDADGRFGGQMRRYRGR
jgi:hypothetical protein